MFKKVKTKLEKFILDNEYKNNYLKATKMNRHDRRALGKLNGIGMIPKKP